MFDPMDDTSRTELASREALSKGLTTVSDAGSPPQTIDVMKKVVDEGKLPLRVWMMLRESVDRLAVAGGQHPGGSHGARA